MIPQPGAATSQKESDLQRAPATCKKPQHTEHRRQRQNLVVSAILSVPIPADALCGLLLAVVASIIWLNLTDRDGRARRKRASANRKNKRAGSITGERAQKFHWIDGRE